MQAATLSQLEMLEQIVHETGLRGDEAGKELERRLNAPTKPLYVHRPQRFLRYYEWLYRETFERRGMESAPSFLDWLSLEEQRLCGIVN